VSTGVGRGVGNGVGNGVSGGVTAVVADGPGSGQSESHSHSSSSSTSTTTRRTTSISNSNSSRGGSKDDNTFTMVDTNDGETHRVRGHGRFEFTDDDADVKSLSPGGYLDIEETTSAGSARVEFQAQPDGTIQRRWWKNGHEASFEPEGRAWLRVHLREVMRRAGLAAEARVARILRAQGPGGVLNEVSQCPSDYVKRVYLTLLVGTQPLDAMTLTGLLAQTNREVRSAYDRRVILTTVAAHRVPTEDARLAYVDVTRGTRSDYDRRVALEALLKAERLSVPVLRAVLASTMEMQSAYDGRTVLEHIAATQQLTGDLRQLYIEAADKLRSQYDRGRALAALTHNETASTR
jgi:hypothetical protein